MNFLLRLCLVCAPLMPVVHAETINVTTPPAVAKAKPKRLKWLRRICSSEVNLAMKLSAIGIEQSNPPSR